VKPLRLGMILGVIAAVFGGLALWDEWKTKQEEATEKTKNKLIDFKLEDISGVEVLVTDEGKQVTSVLQKAGDQWTLVSPIKAAVDQDAVKNLLQAVLDYKYEEKIGDDPATAGQYGLDKPETQVTLLVGADKRETLKVGQKAAVGYSSFISLASSPNIYIGGQHITMAVNKKPNDFRDRTIFRTKADEVLGLEFSGTKSEVIIERKAATEKFVLVKPVSEKADSDSVEDFISGLSAIKASDFIDAPSVEVKRALSAPKPLAELAFRLANSSRLDVVFAELKDKLYVKFGDGSVYTVDSNTKSKLDRDLFSFQDKAIFSFVSADLESLDADGESYRKTDKGWIPSQSKDDADVKNHIRDLVVDLEFAKADKIMKQSEVAGLMKSAPKHKIQLQSKGQSAKLEILVWPDPKDPGHVMIKSSHSERVVRGAKSIFAKMVPASDPADSPAGEADAIPPLDDSVDSGPMAE
jgi:hypothetical protein